MTLCLCKSPVYVSCLAAWCLIPMTGLVWPSFWQPHEQQANLNTVWPDLTPQKVTTPVTTCFPEPGLLSVIHRDPRRHWYRQRLALRGRSLNPGLQTNWLFAAFWHGGMKPSGATSWAFNGQRHNLMQGKHPIPLPGVLSFGSRWQRYRRQQRMARGHGTGGIRRSRAINHCGVFVTEALLFGDRATGETRCCGMLTFRS